VAKGLNWLRARVRRWSGYPFWEVRTKR